MTYDTSAARRIMAGNLSNLYNGIIDEPAAIRQLAGLAGLAGDNGDVECETMCHELAKQLEAGDESAPAPAEKSAPAVQDAEVEEVSQAEADSIPEAQLISEFEELEEKQAES